MPETIRNFYLRDEYIKKNPNLHEEDSAWKYTKIVPFADEILSKEFKPNTHLTFLDIGGGAGLILKQVVIHTQSKFGDSIQKIILDLSPGMLRVQIKNNPDVSKVLNEDICQTTLSDKEIDIAFMIDVLEHISDTVKALKEINRISKYAILKVPLQSNLLLNCANFISQGKIREQSRKNLGHINYYSTPTILRQVKQNGGRILAYSFTNWHQYQLNSLKTNWKEKIKCRVGMSLFKVSPKLCSLVLSDFIIILIKCD
ncbi:MAG: class I SAM-dependent methyltransferase [Candidatus Bathyarchaeia archaeon]|jgi:ubiquinone/menaquinone biosynthesis C-methylase UbiE